MWREQQQWRNHFKTWRREEQTPGTTNWVRNGWEKPRATVENEAEVQHRGNHQGNHCNLHNKNSAMLDNHGDNRPPSWKSFSRSGNTNLRDIFQPLRASWCSQQQSQNHSKTMPNSLLKKPANQINLVGQGNRVQTGKF